MNIYAVVGLGYVGLNLATAFAKKNCVIGYDINAKRIETLQKGYDYNQLIPSDALKHPNLTYTAYLKDIKAANFYIVSVATPVINHDYPDLAPLIQVVKDLATVIKPGDILVFESTVYPGATEEICIPLLEEQSGLKNGQDFHIGYSPERINPGDEAHTLMTTTKIFSAQNPEILEKIKAAYQTVCPQVYPVSNIATAEAVKLLENIQRDINIAFMNEFSKIMHALGLNMHEIIEAAKTKWGFVPYKPGFVGGHCIAVDPFYLAFQAKRHGVYPELLLGARKINDGMTQFVIQSMLKLILKKKLNTQHLKIALLGITYKENVKDVRNSLSLKLLKELNEYDFNSFVHDPIVQSDHGLIKLADFETLANINVVIITVAHDFYRKVGLKAILEKCDEFPIIMDIPNLFIAEHEQFKDVVYWNL